MPRLDGVWSTRRVNGPSVRGDAWIVQAQCVACLGGVRSTCSVSVCAGTCVRAWVGARARGCACVGARAYIHVRVCLRKTQTIVYRVRNRILFSLSLLKPFRRHFS